MIILQRLLHLIFGHAFEGSELLETLRSEKHPNSDDFYVFSVGVRVCKCGLTYTDEGLESRKLTYSDLMEMQRKIIKSIK